MNFKNIHIGQLIETLVAEREIKLYRICNFMKSTEKEINEMYNMKSFDGEILLRWCKLLEYDFFRIYSQHLILYTPTTIKQEQKSKVIKSQLPHFRKNIYTKEIIEFILEQIENGEMTKNQVMEKYKIPKTTLYKWVSKYHKQI